MCIVKELLTNLSIKSKKKTPTPTSHNLNDPSNTPSLTDLTFLTLVIPGELDLVGTTSSSFIESSQKLSATGVPRIRQHKSCYIDHIHF